MTPSLLPRLRLSSSDSSSSFLLNVAFLFPQIPALNIIQKTPVCNFYPPVNFLPCINWFLFLPSPLHIHFHSVGPLHHVFWVPVADHRNPEGVRPTTINSRSSVYKKQPIWILLHAEHAQNPRRLHLHSSDLCISKCDLSDLAKLWYCSQGEKEERSWLKSHSFWQDHIFLLNVGATTASKINKFIRMCPIWAKKKYVHNFIFQFFKLIFPNKCLIVNMTMTGAGWGEEKPKWVETWKGRNLCQRCLYLPFFISGCSKSLTTYGCYGTLFTPLLILSPPASFNPFSISLSLTFLFFSSLPVSSPTLSPYTRLVPHFVFLSYSTS